MRRRKPTTTAQINLRLDERLIHELEARAKESRVTFSEIIRKKIMDSEPSLAGFIDGFKHEARSVLERGAPPEGIEAVWLLLQALDALSAKFYTDVETLLMPHVANPEIRKLLRGAPALPDETTSKHKPSQQEREKGGK
jgi:hypothetical protein